MHYLDMVKLISETADRILAGGFNPRTSPWEHRVCMMLITAQGIIDNGGFEYFFESEFDGSPDMNDFVLVYDAVGASSSANAVKEALLRAKEPVPYYADLDDLLWQQSEQNYARLADYIAAHPASYE